jgi:hypothetical protein
VNSNPKDVVQMIDFAPASYQKLLLVLIASFSTFTTFAQKAKAHQKEQKPL